MNDYEPHDMDLSALGYIPNIDPTQAHIRRVKVACERAKKLITETDRILARVKAQRVLVLDETPTGSRVLQDRTDMMSTDMTSTDTTGADPNDLIDAWLARGGVP